MMCWKIKFSATLLTKRQTQYKTHCSRFWHADVYLPFVKTCLCDKYGHAFIVREFGITSLFNWCVSSMLSHVIRIRANLHKDYKTWFNPKWPFHRRVRRITKTSFIISLLLILVIIYICIYVVFSFYAS